MLLQVNFHQDVKPRDLGGKLALPVRCGRDEPAAPHGGPATVTGNIVWAWILTIPAAACLAAMAYWLGLLLF
ncbi:MAG: hypothetical protein JWR60_609 [Polaromonas sp.]|nr:hypothetical protein [Polaromonas sp.]